MSFFNKQIRSILPLFLTVFVDSISMGIILPVLTPLFFNNDSLLGSGSGLFTREFFYGVTLFVFALGMFISTPILGELSDEIGRKKILIFCLSGVAVSYLLSVLGILYGSLGLLIVSRFVGGICSGAISTAQAAVIDVCPPDEKTKYLSLLLFPVSIGFVAGPLFSTFFAGARFSAQFSMTAPLVLAALLAVLNLGFLIYSFKETYKTRGKIKLKLASVFLIFKHAIENPAIRLLAITFFFFEMAWALYFQYISVFVYQRFHYGNAAIGFFMAVTAAGFSFAFLYLIPRLAKRYSSFSLFRATFVVTIACNLITVWSPFESLIWGITFINSVWNAIGYSNAISLFSNKVGPEHQGWIMGVTAAIFSLGMAITSLLGSALGLVSVDLILYVIVALNVMGLVLCRYSER